MTIPRYALHEGFFFFLLFFFVMFIFAPAQEGFWNMTTHPSEYEPAGWTEHMADRMLINSGRGKKHGTFIWTGLVRIILFCFFLFSFRFPREG